MKLAKKISIVAALFALAFSFQIGSTSVYAGDASKSVTKAYKSSTHRGIRSVPSVRSYFKQEKVIRFQKAEASRLAGSQRVHAIQGGRRA